MEPIASRYAIQRPNWYVIYTKSRCEKKVADLLSESGFEVYCPLVKTKKAWSDRLKTVEEPLLKSYCFVKCTDVERPEVRFVPGVVRFLFWLGKPAVVKQNVINQLQKNLSNYSANSIQIERIEKGEDLVVKSGPFVNQIGKTIEVKGKRIVMLLEQLGIRITIDTLQNRVEKVKKILIKLEE